MSNHNFVCESGTHGVGCGPPGCICIQLGPGQKETDCSYIGEFTRQHPTVREKYLSYTSSLIK